MTLTMSSKKSGVLFLALCFSAALAKSSFRSSSRHLHSRSVKMATLRQEMDQALNEAMGHGHGVRQAEMEAKKAIILPMFESMPKNMYGHVGLDAMQYMVHRYFGSVHGWSIRGFTPSGSETNTTSDLSAARILKQRLPRYIEAVLESRLENQGFSMADAVTMVAVLERMIFDEGVELLESAYRMRGLDTGDRLTTAQLTKVMDSYMLIYSFGLSSTNRTQHEADLRLVAKEYPKGYPSVVYGQSHLRAQMEQSRAENPFADATAHSFDLALQGVTRANENYGRWSNEEECVALKEGLSELDREGSGRVRIADFYARGEIGLWEFTEKLEYLRGLGVLDESSASRGPQLMIPNYVQSLSNCIDVSNVYSICCIRECEGLLGTIEREVRAPLASPAQLFEVTQRLIDAREGTPRNLTLQLKAQLEAVAEMHHGKVPIHGRLFQQWLHYAFPYECPYPSKRDAVDPMIISEWTNRTGSDALYTAEEMQEVLKTAEKEQEAQDLEDATRPEMIVADPQVREMSAWTMEEELYVGYHHQGSRRAAGGLSGSNAWAALRWLAQIGMVVGGFMSLRDFASKQLNMRLPSVFFLLDDFVALRLRTPLSMGLNISGSGPAKQLFV